MRDIPDTDAVKEILPVPRSVTSLEPFITVAHNLVEKVIVANYPDAHTDEHLYEIERWLAAHFAAIRYTRTSSESIGQVAESFQHKVDLDLRVTMYGQQAIVLDTTGALANMHKARASVSWIGKPLSQQRGVGDGGY